MIIPVAIIVSILSFVFWLGTRWAFYNVFNRENNRRKGYQEKPASVNVVLLAELVLVAMVTSLFAIKFFGAV